MAVFKPGLGGTFAGTVTVTTGGLTVSAGTTAVQALTCTTLVASSTAQVNGLAGFGAANASGAQVDVRCATTTNYAIDARNTHASGYGLYVAAGDTVSHVSARVADKDNNTMVTVFGNGAVTVGTTNVSNMADFDLRVNAAFWIADGVTAPTGLAGFAAIYVDTADGDLKVKFGDGTTKTLATDT